MELLKSWLEKSKFLQNRILSNKILIAIEVFKYLKIANDVNTKLRCLYANSEYQRKVFQEVKFNKYRTFQKTFQDTR